MKSKPHPKYKGTLEEIYFRKNLLSKYDLKFKRHFFPHFYLQQKVSSKFWPPKHAIRNDSNSFCAFYYFFNSKLPSFVTNSLIAFDESFMIFSHLLSSYLFYVLHKNEN